MPVDTHIEFKVRIHADHYPAEPARGRYPGSDAYLNLNLIELFEGDDFCGAFNPEAFTREAQARFAQRYQEEAVK